MYMHRTLSWTGLVTLVAVSTAGFLMAASPFQEEPKIEHPQIVLVFDVSGSMGQYVLPEDMPEELAALHDQLEQIENDPEYVRLSEELNAIYERPEVEKAQQTMNETQAALDDWISESGHGDGLLAIGDGINGLLADYGCDETFGPAIVYSTNMSGVDQMLNMACSAKGVTLDDEQRQAVRDMVAYIEEPDFQALRQASDEATRAYGEVLSSVDGFQEIMTQLNDLQSSQNYNELQDEFNTLAEELGIPTRLNLAKMAALTLLDLSRLDSIASGRESSVGLVAFSDRATLIQSLTTDYGPLEAQIEELKPLYSTNISDGLSMALDDLAENGDPEQPSAIILLSDGYANRGLLPEQIQDQIPDQAGKFDTTICTIGFGNEEDEVDAELLGGLADATDGEYLFAKSGEELVTFFIACRQGLVSRVVDQFTGAVREGEMVEVGRVEVGPGVQELNLTLNYLEGQLVMDLIDPDGNTVDTDYHGVSIQQGENVQLITINNPPPGEWVVQVEAKDAPQEGAIYNVVVGIEQRSTPMPTSSLMERAGPYLGGGCVCLALILVVAGVIFAVVYRRRRRDETAQPS
jgi:hypothetical protein